MRKIAPRPDKAEVTKTPALPRAMKARTLPKSAPDGTIMASAGKYSRNAVLTVFEMLGGTEAMAEYYTPIERRGKFYESIFPRTIQKDVEVGVSDDVESLLERLDTKKQVEMDDEMTIDAEFEMVGDTYADTK